MTARTAGADKSGERNGHGDGVERTTIVGQLMAEYWPWAPPFGELPDATPADGPDPYGNPDPEWLRIDWGRHRRSIDLDPPAGVRPRAGGALGPSRIEYVEMGSGPLTLLFVHGLSGSWQNWLENLPHFSRAHRVVALDLPGSGSSPLPPWENSIEAHGRVLHDFCKAIGVGDCAVIGNSMGGFVSAEAALREPERFEKVVLVSAAGIMHARLRRQPIETAARMGAAVSPLFLRFQERGMLRPRTRYLTFRGLVHRPEVLRPELLVEQFNNGAGRPGFAEDVGGLIGYDFLDRLEQVEVPTLIVWGRNDRVVPASDAYGYAEHLTHSEVVIFDRTGHIPMLERPVRFNRLVEEFLAEG